MPSKAGAVGGSAVPLVPRIESNLKPGLLVPKLDGLSTEPHQVSRWRKELDILQAPSEQ